jgi:tetratricopeptide (TPR) repeat protein
MNKATERVLAGCLLALPALTAEPAGYLLARRSADGKVTYEVVEGFLIAERNKVRVWSGAGETLTEQQYRQAKAVPLARAGAFRKDAQGRLAQLAGEGPQRGYILPDGVKWKGAIKIADLASQVSLTAVKSRKAKQPARVPAAEFFALLPASSPPYEAVQFVLRDGNFLGLDEQLSAMEGVVQAFRAAPETAALREFLLVKIRDGLAALEDGGPYKNFLIIVQFAELARRAFPEDKALAGLHTDIVDRKTTTERTLARLTSLANNAEWDTFLEHYAPFEQFQWSFPEMMALRTKALQESARLHAQRGHAFAAQKKYPEALAEYDTAVRRDPDNELIAQTRERVLNDYAQSQAETQRKARKQFAEGSMELRLFRRHLEFASQYSRQKQYDEALRELERAEEIDKDAPEILLGRAEVFYERGELWRALPLLDEFDRAAVTAESRIRGETLRNKVLFDRQTKKNDYRQKLAGMLKSGLYSEADELAQTALKLDQNDDEFNYYASLYAALLRKNDAARTALRKYLDVSVSLRGDLKRRSQVSRILTALNAPPRPAASGAANWFSGRPLPEGVYYCPESLAFQPRITAVEGEKMMAAFEWLPDGKLKSISTAFRDAKGETNYRQMATRAAPAGAPAPKKPGSFLFLYHPTYPQVLKITQNLDGPSKFEAPFRVRMARLDGGGLRLVDQEQSLLTLLQSNPSLNPDIVALLDSPAAVGAAGNSFFNPFVWDGVHYFQFTYDKLGRVETAREIGADNVVRFTWDGERLTSLRAFKGNAAAPVYTRTPAYSGRQLLYETVQYQGKTYKIEYRYRGNQLVAAEFNDNGAHDGKSWRVQFQ